MRVARLPLVALFCIFFASQATAQIQPSAKRWWENPGFYVGSVTQRPTAPKDWLVWSVTLPFKCDSLRQLEIKKSHGRIKALGADSVVVVFRGNIPNYSDALQAANQWEYCRQVAEKGQLPCWTPKGNDSDDNNGDGDLLVLVVPIQSSATSCCCCDCNEDDEEEPEPEPREPKPTLFGVTGFKNGALAMWGRTYANRDADGDSLDFLNSGRWNIGIGGGGKDGTYNLLANAGVDKMFRFTEVAGYPLHLGVEVQGFAGALFAKKVDTLGLNSSETTSVSNPSTFVTRTWHDDVVHVNRRTTGYSEISFLLKAGTVFEGEDSDRTIGVVAGIGLRNFDDLEAQERRTRLILDLEVVVQKNLRLQFIMGGKGGRVTGQYLFGG